MKQKPMSEDRSQEKKIHYSILDPTGNITALVESPVDMEDQPETAAGILARHPKVEQVGFVRYHEDLKACMTKKDNATQGFALCPGKGTASNPNSDPVHAELRMAGGEFCGNASMCAAALYHQRHRTVGRQDGPQAALAGNPSKEIIRLRVSGTEDIVEVEMEAVGPETYHGSILMPPALSIEEREFRFAGLEGRLPLVRMEGISHIIIEPDSSFAFLQEKREAAEAAVRAWCKSLKADGLGLMFMDSAKADYFFQDGAEGRGCHGARDEETEIRSLTPLVYIPGVDTIFWENSCASGSSAAGMYLMKKRKSAIDIKLEEPGGRLEVKTDSGKRRIRLDGQVRFLKAGSWKRSG